MEIRTEIRLAGPADAETIHAFIVGLAIYEREPDAVEATPDTLRAQLSAQRPPFEALIAERNGIACGFALFFQSYSTWRGATGIYLEDLFVPEDQRGHGIGFALLRELAGITVQRGAKRLDWQVLDWNEPSIRFYESIGASVRRDWFPCRLDGAELDALGSPNPG